MPALEVPVTPLGVGAAGQVHALAIDPQDANVFYLGTDVAGVWRSTDGGSSWHTWSEGLANPDAGRSFYVDDLLVLEDDVLAATEGGIYRRPRDGGAWEQQTPPDHYSYKFSDADDERRFGTLIPFSTLARDDSTGQLYAGAGTARSRTTWVMYPDVQSAEYPDTGYTFEPYPGGPTGLYSLWVWQGGQWTADTTSTDMGMVRALDALDGRVLLTGTRGIYLRDTDGTWIHLDTDYPLADGTQTGWGVWCWSARFATPEMLYALVDARPGIDDPPAQVGVFRLDLSATDPVWVQVGDPSQLRQPGAAAARSWGDVLSGGYVNRLRLYRSDDGTVELFAGERVLHSLGGLYYLRVPVQSSPENLVWVHMLSQTNDWNTPREYHYYDTVQRIFVPLTDGGWQDNDQINANCEVAIGGNGGSRILAWQFANGWLLDRDQSGVTVANVYTLSMGDGWLTRGDNMLVCHDVTCLPDGTLLLADDDYGVFRRWAGGDGFQWLDRHHSNSCAEDSVTRDALRVDVVDGDMLAIHGRRLVSDCPLLDDGDKSNTNLRWVLTRQVSTELDQKNWEIVHDTGIYEVIDYERAGPETLLVAERYRDTDWHSRIVRLCRDASGIWRVAGTALTISGKLHDIEVLPSKGLVVAAVHNGDNAGVVSSDYRQEPMELHNLLKAGTGSFLQRCAAGARCVAADSAGTVLYVGTAGDQNTSSSNPDHVVGTVLRLPDPHLDAAEGEWQVLANDGEDTFDFGSARHFYRPDWSGQETADRMTVVWALAVDPRNPTIVYAGLSCGRYHIRNGVWRYMSGLWDQIAGQGEGLHEQVLDLEFDTQDPSRLYVGTNGGYVAVLDVSGLYAPLLTTYKNRSAAADSNGLSYEGTPYASILLDFDQDGDEDLMMSMQDRHPLMFEKTGVNTRQGVPQFNGTSNVLPAITTATRGLAAADYDNDHRPDVFLAAEGGSYLLHNEGGTFSDAADSTFHAQTDHAWAGAWGDWNLDGWADLYVCRASNPDTTEKRPSADATGNRDCFFLNGYGNGFCNMYNFFFPDSTDAEPTFAACWGDVDLDGDLDLFVPSMRPGGATPASHLYIHHDSDDFFDDEFSSRFPGILMGQVTSCLFTDLDGDGDLDLVTTSVSKAGSSLERTRLYWNDGGGYFTEDQDALPGAAQYAASEARPLDVDLDGLMDLVLCPLDSTQAPRLYRNTGEPTGNGGVQFVDVSAESGLDAAGIVDGAIATDLDGDGDPDLLLGSPKDEYRYYWSAVRADGAESLGRYHLSVRLEDRGSHASDGLGAQVWIEDGSGNRLAPVRLYDGGSGRGGQQPPVLRFGLGTWLDPVTVKVRWPGGYGQRIQSVTVNPTVQDTVTVVDDTRPECVNLVITTYLNPDQTINWKVEWDTNNLSRASRDRLVMVQPDGTVYNAYVGKTGTLHTCRLHQQGSQHHSFLLECRPCQAGFYQVTVYSSNDAYEDSASDRVQMLACVSGK